MPPDRRKYLWDALTAAELLFEFGAGKTLADYKTDPLLRRGARR